MQGKHKDSLVNCTCLTVMAPGARRFLETPGNYQAREAVLFSIPDGSLETFENYTVKFSAKERKWTSLEARTHPTFLEISISK